MKLSSGFAAGAVGLAALASLFHARAPAPGASALALETRSPSRARAVNAPARSSALVVYVTGEVIRPGLYRFAEGARIDDAVRAAGGFTARGDRLATDLAEPLRDGEEVLIAPAGAVDPYAAVASQGAEGLPRARRRTRAPGSRARSRGPRGGRTSRKPLPASPVDLNGADAGQLATLPGVGPGLAARIVAFREANGPFASVDDLLDVAGMSDHKLDAIDPYVRVGTARAAARPSERTPP